MSVQKEVYLKHLTYLGPELLNHVLALQVPDLDGGASGGAQPVPGRFSLKFKLFIRGVLMLMIW